MFLTREQVQALNEKYGYFQYADAQGDVSRDFAQAAIEQHERVRGSAQDMLAILRRLADAVEALDGTTVENEDLVDDYRALMLKIDGAA